MAFYSCIICFVLLPCFDVEAQLSSSEELLMTSSCDLQNTSLDCGNDAVIVLHQLKYVYNETCDTRCCDTSDPGSEVSEQSHLQDAKIQCRGQSVCQLPLSNVQMNFGPYGLVSPSYVRVEYYCVERSRMVSICATETTVDGTNTTVYLTNVDYPSVTVGELSCSCSLEVDPCSSSDVVMYSVDVDLYRDESLCEQFFTVHNGSGNMLQAFECEDYFGSPIQFYTLAANYVNVTFTSTSTSNLQGQFMIGFEASERGATFSLMCQHTEQRFCTVDGEWSFWSNWTECSQTCGSGLQTRERTCTNPSPSNGGADCVGESTENRTCNEENCPVDGSWTAWSGWSDCSKTCGIGLRHRDRSCSNPSPSDGGNNCAGLFREGQLCNTQNCPAQLSSSEELLITSSCDLQNTSLDCGSDAVIVLRQLKYVYNDTCDTRCCDTSDPGSGVSEQSHLQDAKIQCRGHSICQLPLSNVQMNFGPYGLVSPSYVRVEYNCIERSRMVSICATETTVDGSNATVYLTNVDYPSVTVGELSCSCSLEIDPCSSSDIVMYSVDVDLYRDESLCEQSLTVYNGSGNMLQAFECEDYFGSPIQFYILPANYVNVTFTSTSTSNLQGQFMIGFEASERGVTFNLKCQHIEQQFCTVIDGNWTAWSGWSKCSKTCGTGSRYRDRSCSNPSPSNGGITCAGLFREEQLCNTQFCPVNGGWATWSAWSTCSKSCGSGQQNRKRNCSNPPPSNGGAYCIGTSTQSRTCNSEKCQVKTSAGSAVTVGIEFGTVVMQLLVAIVIMYINEPEISQS